MGSLCGLARPRPGTDHPLYWGIGSPLSDHESMLTLPLSLHVMPTNPLILLAYHAITLAMAKHGLSTASAHASEIP
jgi:hypothetical protein